MSKPLHILRRERRKKTKEEVKAELDMTSMIDVVFLLLIFFMCATKFRQPEGNLRTWLPRDRGTSGGPPQVNPGCRITLMKDGADIICIGDQSQIPFVSQYGGDDVSQAQADFESEYALRGPVLRLVEQHIQLRKDTYMGVSAKGLPVIIDFGKEVPAVYVANIVDICKKLRIEDIAFAQPEIPIDGE